MSINHTESVLFNADFVKSVLAENINEQDSDIIESARASKDANGYYRMVNGIRIGLGTVLVKPSWITNMPNGNGARIHCISKGSIATFGMTPSSKEKGINTVLQHGESLRFRTGIETPKSIPTKGNADWKAWICVVDIMFPKGIPVDVVENPNDPSELNVQFAGRNQLEILSQRDELNMDNMSVEEKMKHLYGINIDSVDEEAALTE